LTTISAKSGILSAKQALSFDFCYRGGTKAKMEESDFL